MDHGLDHWQTMVGSSQLCLAVFSLRLFFWKFRLMVGLEIAFGFFVLGSLLITKG